MLPGTPSRTGRDPVLAACAAIVIASGAIAAFAAWRGLAARHFAAESVVVVGATLADALPVWRREGVRGRVLVHFARRIAMDDTPGAPSTESFVRRAVEEGVVRRIVHVIPDDAWREVSAALEARTDATRDGRTYRLRPMGVRLDVVRLADVPDLAEPALITVEAERWSPEALAWIVARMRAPETRFDIAVWTGPTRALGLPIGSSIP